MRDSRWGRVGVCAVVAMLGALACRVLAEGDVPPPGGGERMTFAILYSPGASWVAGKPVFEQPLAEHAAYMQRLLEAGTLVMGGPFTDSSGGLAILSVGSPDEAQRVVREDPAVTSGVLRPDLRPWLVAFRAGR